MQTGVMRAVVGAVGGVVAGAALAVAAAGPAAAKGPMGVTIAVPGEAPVELLASDGPGDLRMQRLADDLGVWETTGDGLALAAEPPTEYLGPALTVEWTMYNPVPANPDAAPRVIQTLYPQAGGGALVHTEGGQRYFADDVTIGGWYRAPDRLIASLAALGVETKFRLPDSDPAAAATTQLPHQESDRLWATAMRPTAALAVALIIGLAAGWAVRRRRQRAALAAD